jgi:hypothetical protein
MPTRKHLTLRVRTEPGGNRKSQRKPNFDVWRNKHDPGRGQRAVTRNMATMRVWPLAAMARKQTGSLDKRSSNAQLMRKSSRCPPGAFRHKVATWTRSNPKTPSTCQRICNLRSVLRHKNCVGPTHFVQKYDLTDCKCRLRTEVMTPAGGSLDGTEGSTARRYNALRTHVNTVLLPPFLLLSSLDCSLKPSPGLCAQKPSPVPYRHTAQALVKQPF